MMLNSFGSTESRSREQTTLGETATFINGYAFKPTEWATTGREIIRIQNLTKSTSETNYFDGVLPQKYLVKRGDLLISWSATLGVYEWHGEDAWVNQHIFKVVFDKKDMDKRFFKYLIQSKLHELERQVHGATMKHITKGKFDAIPVTLPPLHIQQQIANTLDKADALRRKDQELLQKYDELAQSIFYDMFGNPVRNEKGWETKAVSDVCSLENGDRSSNYPTVKDFVPVGIPFYGTHNLVDGELSDEGLRFISPEKFTSLTRGKLQNNDLVITLRGSIGVCSIFRTTKHLTGFINAQMMIIRPSHKVNSLFLRHLLTTAEMHQKLRSMVGGSAVPQLTGRQIGDLQIIIPDPALQATFANTLNATIRSKRLSSLTDSETLFNSLLEKYFA